jgi:hypothetical protein
MNIEELLIENLEEGPGFDTAKAGLKGIAQGAGQVAKGAAMGAPGAAGGLAKGVGAVAGGIAGAWDKAKQGFQAGKAAVGGTAPATDTPAVGQDTAAPATNAPAVGQAPATGGSGTADFGTIQRSIKSLSPNQKTALANQLAGKPATAPAATAPAPAAPAATAPAPAAPAATAPAPAAPAATGPQKGQEVALASGEKYRFAGQQWVEVNPTTGAEMGGAALPAGFQKSLNGIAAKQASAPAATGGTPDLKVVDGGKAAVAEGFYYRSKFLNIIL